MLTILPEPPIWKALLGFDFDDTLVMKSGTPAIDPQFFETVRWVRANYGAAWGIATGRSLYQLIEGFNEAKFPCLPDFVVARERELYFPGQFGRWLPHDEWNKVCEKHHKKVFRKSKRTFGKIRKFIESATEARWVSADGDAAGIVATDHDEMDRILEFVESLRRPADLAFERNSVYLRFSHREFSKGSGLLEAADRWGLGPDKILAVGDNYNDLSMLQPDISEACGCPSNAVAAVREFVAARGGKVAEKPGSLGVMEVMRHYFDQ